ncbi:hypothetical protein BDV93DRAFT_559664 [Ceratobasidium sp. AG-I]|nr:hypothetical protein BDV93DRAFT_559664 [Ceratobasidium sp. AG-I]
MKTGELKLWYVCTLGELFDQSTNDSTLTQAPVPNARAAGQQRRRAREREQRAQAAQQAALPNAQPQQPVAGPSCPRAVAVGNPPVAGPSRQGVAVQPAEADAEPNARMAGQQRRRARERAEREQAQAAQQQAAQGGNAGEGDAEGNGLPEENNNNENQMEMRRRRKIFLLGDWMRPSLPAIWLKENETEWLEGS